MNLEYTVDTKIEYEYLRDTLETLVRPLAFKRMLPYGIPLVIALLVLTRGSAVLGTILLLLALFILFRNATSRSRYINRVIKQVTKTSGNKPVPARLQIYDGCFSLAFKNVERTYTLHYSTVTHIERQGSYLTFRCYNDYAAVLPMKGFDTNPDALKAFLAHCNQAEQTGF